MAKERGFSLLSKEKRKVIARLGGQAAHRRGTAHQFTREEARAAGRLGGLAKRRNAAAGDAPREVGGQ